MTAVPGPVRAAFVLIVKVAVVSPAATATDEGTVETEVSEELSVTTAPAAGAGAEIVTVPTEVPPALTEVGEIVKVESVPNDVNKGRRQIPRP